MPVRVPKDDEKGLSAAIRHHQLAAAASPDKPIGELIGNFEDLERLFEQLYEPALIPLGQPLPEQKDSTKPRVGTCPAAHNRALLGDENEISEDSSGTSGARKARR